MGMIYQRGEIYWVKYYRNGKPYRESTKSIKETDARRLLKKREGEIAGGFLGFTSTESVSRKLRVTS